jgi:phosphoadenosine phosphosulfate reductase
MGSALRREDVVHAKLGGFQRRVAAALDSIHQAAEACAPLGVSYSGGKDSEVTLHLVRSVIHDAPAAFFDSGCELASTMDRIRAVGAEICAPRMTMIDMARYAGWWDYASPVDRECEFDAKAVVIQEPSEAFVVRRGLRALALGLRGEESSARAKHASRGTIYRGADRTYYVQPIIMWTLSDVWAYIASRGLEYNAAYDRMSDAGIPREFQRVATLLGDRGSGWGRHALMRRAEPERWREVSREFPGLARFT